MWPRPTPFVTKSSATSGSRPRRSASIRARSDDAIAAFVFGLVEFLVGGLQKCRGVHGLVAGGAGEADADGQTDRGRFEAELVLLDRLSEPLGDVARILHRVGEVELVHSEKERLLAELVHVHGQARLVVDSAEAAGCPGD